MRILLMGLMLMSFMMNKSLASKDNLEYRLNTVSKLQEVLMKEGYEEAGNILKEWENKYAQDSKDINVYKDFIVKLQNSSDKKSRMKMLMNPPLLSQYMKETSEDMKDLTQQLEPVGKNLNETTVEIEKLNQKLEGAEQKDGVVVYKNSQG